MKTYIHKLTKEYAGPAYLPYAKHFMDQFGREYSGFDCPVNIQDEIIKRLRRVKSNHTTREYILRESVKDTTREIYSLLKKNITKELENA